MDEQESLLPVTRKESSTRASTSGTASGTSRAATSRQARRATLATQSARRQRTSSRWRSRKEHGPRT
eukprot:12910973-Heterocapsa_arctica.AAC.1